MLHACVTVWRLLRHPGQLRAFHSVALLAIAAVAARSQAALIRVFSSFQTKASVLEKAVDVQEFNLEKVRVLKLFIFSAS